MSARLTAATKRNSRNTVVALARGIDVLKVFTVQDVWLGNAEIAARVSLAKATVSRVAASLTQLGYLQYSHRLRKYRLGLAVLGLGYSQLGDHDARSVARPGMQWLADEYNGAVCLTVRDGFDLIHIETCHSRRSPLSLRLDSEARIPIASTVIGRVLLSALPPQERKHLLEQLRLSYGAGWIRVQKLLMDDWSSLRKSGFALGSGPWQPDVRMVAVPLFLAEGRAPLALGFIGFAGQWSEKSLKEGAGPHLAKLSARISADVSQRSANLLSIREAG